MKKTVVVILAAGKSKRMNSEVPKVLHPICGRPMLNYVLDLAEAVKPDKIIVVLGYKYKEVKKLLKPKIKIVIQKKLLGTADAVKRTKALLKDFTGDVLVLYADNPLLRKETIKGLVNYHKENASDATLLTTEVKDPQGYGRVIRDKYASICKVVEEGDANELQKRIKEINTGIICFKAKKLFQVIRSIKLNKRKKEYYLTDTIGLLYQTGALIDSFKLSDPEEALGINSRNELALANKIMQRRINAEIMKKGVNIIDPESTFINYGTKIGRDTTIYPFTVIESNVKIGKRCRIGPFIHLREGTRIQDDVVAGNFLEVVRSQIADKTEAKHFSYLGDCFIGRSVNIGAGTIIANFDGKRKNKTIIKDKAFIGSGTILIAPVKVGRQAITGAGAVVVKKRDVPDRTIVVGVPARPLRRINAEE
ncbi:MAG: NTP transferase domain-containing protein [Candidatus Omnitrophica bacterium]|nr:NTP transferase domain-containing protein [Candidatus Omnitrophota bacterium]